MHFVNISGVPVVRKDTCNLGCKVVWLPVVLARFCVVDMKAFVEAR